MNAFESPISSLPSEATAGGPPRSPEGAVRRTRTPKGKQTRALILETALDLFMERGYEETTMRAIAERADELVARGHATDDLGVLGIDALAPARR
jgi:hypothetical protein